MTYRIPHPWIKADPRQRAFNGLTLHRIIGDTEQGIFYEQHGSWNWFVRSRPVGDESWGYGTPAGSKREAMQIGDRMAQKMKPVAIVG